MSNVLLETEGTWSEIVAKTGDFDGQRVHLVVTDQTSETIASIASTSGNPATNGAHIELAAPQTSSSLGDIFAAIRAKNSEAWADLPSDLAEQHDHYLYGLPKK